jgi:phage uncharacterized protein TIGR01671
MREIKFRVFDKASKYNPMHIVGEDSHDSFWIDSDNVFHYSNLQNGEGSGECGDYILMQYTDLKDTNKKEIYEGDILWDEHNEEYCEVIFECGKFVCNFETNSIDLSDISDELIVIGNIYENKELIGDEE